MRLSPSILALAGSLILLAGCSSGTSGQVDVQMDEGPVVTGGMAVPDDWASDVPVYAGADVQYTATVNPIDGRPGAAMVLTTSDSVQAVADFYKAELESNGWALEASVAGPMGTIIGGTKDNRSVSMLIAASEGMTSITIGVETHTD